MAEIWIFLFFITLPLAQGAAPGTFFWKPRLGLDLGLPVTDTVTKINQANAENIKSGLVILIDGYSAGMTIAALAFELSLGEHVFPHLYPTTTHFYNNAYRWALRYMSLIPPWFSGKGGSYVDTHRVWKKRFLYMDRFMPKWMRTLLPFIPKEEWAKEEFIMQRYNKYAEPAFGKHYRYPNKKFNNFASCDTVETFENMGASSNYS